MEKTDNMCVLIMAGGIGTRFWPKSTEEKPKQFISLLEERTMIQITVDRIKKILPIEKIFISTGKRYRNHRDYLDHKKNSKDFYDALVEKIGSNRFVAQFTETTRHDYIIKVINDLPPNSLLFLDNAFNNDYNDKEMVNFESNYENDLGAY